MWRGIALDVCGLENRGYLYGGIGCHAGLIASLSRGEVNVVGLYERVAMMSTAEVNDMSWPKQAWIA